MQLDLHLVWFAADVHKKTGGRRDASAPSKVIRAGQMPHRVERPKWQEQ